MNKKQIALTLYTIRNFCQTEKDLVKSLQKVKNIGYSAIQVSSIGPINPRIVKNICDDLELLICATHEPNELIINNTNKIIEKLNIFDCIYTALPYPLNVNLNSIKEIDLFIKKIDKAGSIMKESGKVLCYHNHAIEFKKIENETILERIYRKTNHHNVQGEPDIFWIQKGGHNPIDWCIHLNNRLPLIHLKDFVINENDEGFYAELGQGNLNIPRIIFEAENSGCKWFIVEQDECNKDPFEAIKISYKYLNQISK